MNIIDTFLKSNVLIQILMLILLTFSVVSWGIIIYQIYILHIIAKKIKTFEYKFWSGIPLSELYQNSINQRYVLQGIERIFYFGFKEFKQLHDINNSSLRDVLKETKKIMKIAIHIELQELELYTIFLSVTSSISPYLGLLGTVLSIIYIFCELGTVKYITLQIIAPSISESLIFTAIGLFVAIPATVAFYCFNIYVNKIEQKYKFFLYEFSSVLKKQISSKIIK